MDNGIKRYIAAQGPISVATYMELCAQHYYAHSEPFGAQGDFITAPDISQIFGEIIGAWIAAQWQAQGGKPALLVELGPGRGTLMRDALRATKTVPGFHEAVTLRLVETSKRLRALQRQEVATRWFDTLAEALDDRPLFLIANEFFDALPVRQTLHDGSERYVTWQHDALTFTPEGVVLRETCELAQTITTQIATHITRHGGAALIIDYGYAHGSGDTLQAMKYHRFTHPLAEPGDADITAHVDFAALKTAAQTAQVSGPVGQGEWLARLGAPLRLQQLLKHATAAQKPAMVAGLERLMVPDQMGELFKVMAILPKTVPPPEGF